MKATQHTPGPWRIDDFAKAGVNIKSCGETPNTIAALQRPFPRLVTAEENLANARLIAAAPDGLQFAEDYLQWSEQLRAFPRSLPGQAAIDDAARAYIAKAKGQP